jgi:hypothetical protein
MSKTFSAREIGENVLREVGAYSANDTAADPYELSVALMYLDMYCAWLTETHKINWLIPATIEVDLDTADQASYDLSTLLGSSDPADGVVFLRQSWIDDGNGVESPITQLSRREYEDLSLKTTSGKPEYFYVDRLATPTIYFFPVPGVTTYNARIMVQEATPTMTSNVGASDGNVAHGFTDGWQLALFKNTAVLVGEGGAIKPMPESRLRTLRKSAEDLINPLLHYANREIHSGKARRVKAWGV